MMYSIQSNSARFIYTLNYIPNSNSNDSKQCLLKNGLYFSKESRSDEKIRFTESDLYSIVRTVLFMYVFSVSPHENIVDIINTGEVTHTVGDGLTVNALTLDVAVNLVDSLFGKNFASVVKRVINKCLNEYCTTWRYYLSGSNVKYPSAADYINLSKFVNIVVCEYGDCEKFIMTNSTDHHVPLQQMTKILK